MVARALNGTISYEIEKTCRLIRFICAYLGLILYNNGDMRYVNTLSAIVMVAFGKLVKSDDLKPHGIFDRTVFYNTDRENIIRTEYETTIDYNQDKQIISATIYFRIYDAVYRLYGILFNGCLLGQSS